MNSSEQRSFQWKVILAFTLVYVFWGSTYLGIREAVGTPANPGVPPLLMSGTRFLIAGPLMLLYFVARRRSIRLAPIDYAKQAVLGVLMLTISNTVLAWAEQWVPTGLAALLISITPIYFLILETWVLPGEHRFTGRTLAGIFLGICGIAVLLWPDVHALSRGVGKNHLFPAVILLVGSFSWATGSVLAKRWKGSADPFMASAWQMTFGGAINVAMGLSFGQASRAHYTPHTTGAIIYLVIFGSWVGFTAYIWLLKHVPTPKVATYAYVNPVVAVFLGWLVLHEHITGYILAGTIIVVAAVSLVTAAQLKTRDKSEAVLPELETATD